nr:MAG: hypothetical protein [Helarchaeota virus Nidhogg Meg22_1012]
MFEVLIPRCIRCHKELKASCTMLLCRECQINAYCVTHFRDRGDFSGC